MRCLLPTFVVFQLVGFAFVPLQQNANAQRPASNRPRIQWIEDTPRLAVERSEKLRRPLLIYVTAESCAYCRQMERETWEQSRVIEHVNRDYVTLKLNAERNKLLIENLEVRAYPTTLLIDTEAAVTARLVGYVSPEKLLKFLERQASGRASNR